MQSIVHLKPRIFSLRAANSIRNNIININRWIVINYILVIGVFCGIHLIIQIILSISIPHVLRCCSLIIRAFLVQNSVLLLIIACFLCFIEFSTIVLSLLIICFGESLRCLIGKINILVPHVVIFHPLRAQRGQILMIGTSSAIICIHFKWRNDIAFSGSRLTIHFKIRIMTIFCIGWVLSIPHFRVTLKMARRWRGLSCTIIV